METVDIYAHLFRAGVLFFVLGSVLPMMMRRQQAANLTANGLSFLGGVSMTVFAVHLLLTGHQMKISGWRMLGELYLSVGFDSLAAFFLLVIGVMVSACSLYAAGYATKYSEKGMAGYLGGMMNVFILSLIGVIGMETSVTFLIFWEFMALSSFGLVMFEHERREVRAGGYMYLIMTHVIGVCLSIAFLFLYLYTGSLQFADYQNVGPMLPDGVREGVFFLFFAGFGAKMGLFPINVWLPRAYPVAPSSATALMSSAMIKTAVYALLRVAFDFFGGVSPWCALSVIGVGVVSMVAGVTLGLVQNDMKRFLAYSSVENMGVICVGLGAALYFKVCGLPLLGALALTGTLYHVLAHSVFKSLLFMAAGALLRGAGTCGAGSLGGMMRRMPFTAGAFLIGGMSLASLPPFGGFVSEWMMLQSALHMAFDTGGAFVRLSAMVVLAALGFSGAVAAVAVVKHFGMIFLGKPRSRAAADAVEVNRGMKAGMGFLCALSFVLGVCPGGAFMLTGDVVHRYFSIVLSGGSFFYVPFGKAAGEGISPLAALLVVGFFALLAAAAVRAACGKSRYVLEDTWTCGTVHLPKMAYTAESYSHPALKVLRLMLGLTESVHVEKRSEYTMKRITYRLTIGARVGDRVYKPLIAKMLEWFNKIRVIQSGNLQAYLSYMVAALIITLLWIRQV